MGALAPRNNRDSETSGCLHCRQDSATRTTVEIEIAVPGPKGFGSRGDDMHCSRCGARLAPNTAFCSACGAPVSVEMAGAHAAKRPWIITLLAVLQLIGAMSWLLTMAAYAV